VDFDVGSDFCIYGGMSAPIEFGAGESWEEARTIAGLIGDVPNSFSTCIRFLRTDYEQNGGALSRGTRFYLSRLLKSASVSAPLYFAAMTYRPEQFQAQGGDSAAIMSVFAPDELATLLSLVYLFRTIKKGCDPEEWRFIEEAIILQTDICGIMGDVIPAIGLSNATLVGAIRLLSQALFLGVKKKEFTNYRRALKKSGALADYAEEIKTWGCTHAQVASILVQPVGLGRTLSEQLSMGLLPVPQSNEPKESVGMRVVSQWLQAILTTGKEPQIAHRVEYYPHAKDIEDFLVRANSIRQVGSRYKWITQGKESLTPETAPTMFRTPARASPAAAAPEEAPPPDAPGISDADLAKLED
jgi:hypothetical protein